MRKTQVQLSKGCRAWNKANSEALGANLPWFHTPVGQSLLNACSLRLQGRSEETRRDLLEASRNALFVISVHTLFNPPLLPPIACAESPHLPAHFQQ